MYDGSFNISDIGVFHQSSYQQKPQQAERKEHEKRMKERAQAGETTQDGTNMQTTLRNTMFIDSKRRNARFFCTWNKRLFAMKLLMDEIRQTNWYGRCSVNYTALTHSNCCRSVSINYTCAVRTHKKRNPGFCARQTIKKLLFHHVNEFLLAILQQQSSTFQPCFPFLLHTSKCGEGIISALCFAASMEVMRRWN